MLLVAGAGCRALLDLPDIGESAGLVEDSGVPDTTPPPVLPVTGSDATPAPCKAYLPAEGFYNYVPLDNTKRGREAVFKLVNNGTKEDGTLFPPESIPGEGAPSLRAKLTHKDATTWVFRADLNKQHFTEFTFKTSDAVGLQVISVTEGLFSTIEVKATCSPPVDLLRCTTMVGGEKWFGGAVGTFAFFGNQGSFGATVAFTIIDDMGAAPPSVGGKLVDSFHIHEDRSFTNQVAGTQGNDYWFSKENGLLVRAVFEGGDIMSGVVDGGISMTPAPNLALEYKGRAGFILDKLEAEPFNPPADAGGDAKKDAKQ